MELFRRLVSKREGPRQGIERVNGGADEEGRQSDYQLLLCVKGGQLEKSVRAAIYDRIMAAHQPSLAVSVVDGTQCCHSGIFIH